MGKPVGSALELREVSTTSVPAAGNTLLYVKSDGKVYTKDDLGVETLVGPAAGGGGGTAGAQFDLNQDWSTTRPATPTAGVTVFSRHKARRLLAMMGPNGLDTPVQPGMFNNRISYWAAMNNTNSLSTLGAPAMTAAGTAAAVAVAATNFYTAQVRQRYTTAATAGAGAGVRTAVAQWHMSSTANKGGFFHVCRWGLNTTNTNTRGFIGLSTTTAALAGATQPSALLNLIGFGWDAGDTTLNFISNGGSGTATKVATNASFPVTSSPATNFYETRLFAPSGGGQNVYWSVERLNDGALVQGQYNTGSKMPALDTLLASHVHYSNGSNAVAYALDMQSLYIENDN